MSKRIARIECLDGNIKLDQFYGGSKNGLCVNLTVHEYASLTKKQVQQLVKELQNWLGENELPFPDWSGTE